MKMPNVVDVLEDIEQSVFKLQISIDVYTGDELLLNVGSKRGNSTAVLSGRGA